MSGERAGIEDKNGNERCRRNQFVCSEAECKL